MNTTPNQETHLVITTQPPIPRETEGTTPCPSSSSNARCPAPAICRPRELNAASKVSNEALAALSPRVKWQQSYVTDDKIFCVYLADDPEAIREHAHLAGLPVDSIHLVGAVIDPATGDVAA